jgi:hypothetical protein
MEISCFHHYLKSLLCGKNGFKVEKGGFWFFKNVIQKCEKVG